MPIADCRLPIPNPLGTRWKDKPNPIGNWQSAIGNELSPNFSTLLSRFRIMFESGILKSRKRNFDRVDPIKVSWPATTFLLKKRQQNG
jgi:hypothetical protein